jgi:hypothetical protein
MINDEYELCFAGQLDSISPNDVDFYVTARVTDFVNTKGTYSPQAACPEDYYGEQYLEWELTSAVYCDGTHEEYEVYGDEVRYPTTAEQCFVLESKYSSLISSELWDIIASEQAEEAYDKYDSGRYND